MVLFSECKLKIEYILTQPTASILSFLTWFHQQPPTENYKLVVRKQCLYNFIVALAKSKGDRSLFARLYYIFYLYHSQIWFKNRRAKLRRNVINCNTCSLIPVHYPSYQVFQGDSVSLPDRSTGFSNCERSAFSRYHGFHHPVRDSSGFVAYI